MVIAEETFLASILFSIPVVWMFLKMSAEEIPLGKTFGNRLLNIIGSKAELPKMLHRATRWTH